MPTAPETDAKLAQRFGDARPGRSLVTIVDAALPITKITVDVLAQERKPLPLLDEFVLRLTATGIDTPEEISSLLGLPNTLVPRTVAEQFSADTLRYASGSHARTLQLTSKGKRTVAELSEIRPVREELSLFFDKLSWRLLACESRDLISHHQVEDSGLIILPHEIDRMIDQDDDISPAAINALLKDTTDMLVEVIAVKKFREARARKYLPGKLLVYADPTGEDISLGLVIDDELSKIHDLALARLNAVERLGIRVGRPAERPRLEEELELLRVPTESTSKPTPSSADHPQFVSRNPDRKTTRKPTPPAGEPDSQVPQVPSIEVRGVEVFEHPKLLNFALTSATRRLLIISPWLQAAVVNTDFIGKLEGRLRRNVRVHIAHGYENDKPHRDALRRLNNLARRYDKIFTFTRIQNTHAKILIFDDSWISTSFNWLSFRGDPDRTYRQEEGTLVRNREIVDARYEYFVKKIQDEAIPD